MACMVKNHHLTRAISAASFAEVRRQLTYKTTWRHSRLVVADRFYPSSKTCSACEAVKAELSLAERRYICEACGVIEDRDVNAARNLAQLYPCGEREAQASHSPHERNARGGEGSGRTAVRRNHAAAACTPFAKPGIQVNGYVRRDYALSGEVPSGPTGNGHGQACRRSARH